MLSLALEKNYSPTPSEINSSNKHAGIHISTKIAQAIASIEQISIKKPRLLCIRSLLLNIFSENKKTIQEQLKKIPLFGIIEWSIQKGERKMADKSNGTQDFEVTPVGVSPQNTQGRRKLTPEEIAEIKRRKEARAQREQGKRPVTEEEHLEIKRRKEAREQGRRPALEVEGRRPEAPQRDRGQLTPQEQEELRRRREARRRKAEAAGFTVEPVKTKPEERTPVKKGEKTPEGAPRRKRIKDESGNEYRVDRENEERERRRDQREKERNEKRREIEAASKWFMPKTKEGNYFINLLFMTFKMFVLCILIICVSGIGFVLGMSKSYLETVPELDFGIVEQQDQATVLMDVNGNFLENYYSMENREWATLEELPKSLQDAVIAIEDVRFRRHLGVDFKRLFSVVISNVTSGSMQGGSTITQQLIKNTILSFEQTYKRKIQEASLALELERMYDKDTILEAYLNTIYMGGSCYGVKTAAMDYFGKELSELTLRECACLAGMIQNPSRYNPRSNYYSRNNPDRTDNRTNLVLYEMRENGLITEEEYQAARQDTLTVAQESPFKNEAGMVYFTDYVIDSVVTKILEDRGQADTSQNRTAVRNEIRTSGYNIFTTLDAQKQKAAEKAVFDFTGYPKMRYESDSYTVTGRNPDGTVIRLTQPQAALAVTDYHTGYIVALVGGRQAPTGSLQFNRAYQSTMPVGSSIKPIAVYAPAIEKGSGIGTVYYDYQMKIEGWVSENGYPANNSRTYAGRVNMRTAFVNSLNTSAAQALLYDVGLDTSYNTLVKLGVDPEHISKTGSGLALGSSGITPLEMAGAFSAVANLGTYIEPIAFTRVEDKNGNVIIDMLAKQEKHRVFTESTAWQVADMMRSVATSGIASRVAVSGQTVYGKTGTNSESRGVFFAGFTGYYTCCVWVGSDAYKPLQSNAQGSAYAGPLFSAVMTALHKGLPNKAFTDVSPESIGVQQVKYCTVSGLMASEDCSTTHTEYGDPSRLMSCTMHKKVEICKVSGLLATDACPTDNREVRSMVLTPERPLLKNMYLNYNERFVAVAGNVVISLKRCNADHGQGGVTPTPPTENSTG